MGNLDKNNETVKAVLALYENHEEVPYINPERDLEKWLQAVNIGSESLVPKRNMIRFPEDVLPGHLILLWRIQFGTFTTDSIFPKYFEYDYGINGPKALEELVEKGFARRMSAADSLHHLNAAQLKAILKQNGLSGYSKLNKSELMDFAKEHLNEEQLAPAFDVRGYVLTDAGKALLEKHPEPVDRHPKKKY